MLRVTADDPSETDKIRALGYMGLLTYGQHHQRHHWHLVQGSTTVTSPNRSKGHPTYDASIGIRDDAASSS